jgi:hypothetical protein
MLSKYIQIRHIFAFYFNLSENASCKILFGFYCKIMKKLISIGILFIFLYNIGGYYPWFSILQNNIQNEIEEEIEEGLKSEDLTLIIVLAEKVQEISWIKPNREFQYNGDMYDVVKIKNIPGKKYYYCLNDKKEKQLIAGFNKTNNTKKESEKRLKRNFSYSFYLHPTIETKSEYPIELTFSTIFNFYASNTIDIHSPPPKLGKFQLSSL